MMEAVRTSETSVNFHQTTQSNNTEDSQLHTNSFHISTQTQQLKQESEATAAGEDQDLDQHFQQNFIHIFHVFQIPTT
jgi:hypothetical protein